MAVFLNSKIIFEISKRILRFKYPNNDKSTETYGKIRSKYLNLVRLWQYL